jgi:hypothetical protein
MNPSATNAPTPPQDFADWATDDARRRLHRRVLIVVVTFLHAVAGPVVSRPKSGRSLD